MYFVAVVLMLGGIAVFVFTRGPLWSVAGVAVGASLAIFIRTFWTRRRELD